MCTDVVRWKIDVTANMCFIAKEFKTIYKVENINIGI